MKAYVALREVAVQTLTQKGVPKLSETLMSSDSVMTFVAEYYRADKALYAAAQTTAACDRDA